MIKLKIESRKDWLELFAEFGKAGLLKDVTIREITSLKSDDFPVEIPIQLDGLLGLLGNPLVRPYRKVIDATLHNELAKVIG